MILLDTNVVSEVMKASPAAAVLAWLNAHDSDRLYVSAITVGEIAYGLRVLPDGRRRSALAERFGRFIARGFDQRVLVYDEPAARVYGDVMGERRERGCPMAVPDGQIAAIARSNHLAVATRNAVDFEHCGVDVVNPFENSV